MVSPVKNRKRGKKLVNESFSVFLNLKGKLCVVIGRGKVAERKVNSVLKVGAKIKVISLDVTPTLKRLAEDRKIEWEKRIYQKGDIDSA